MSRNKLGIAAVIVFGLVAFVGWRLSPFHHYEGVAPYKFLFSMQGAFEGEEFEFSQVVKCVAMRSSGGIGTRSSLRFVQSLSYLQFDVGEGRTMQIFVPAMCVEMLMRNMNDPAEREVNYELLKGEHSVIPFINLEEFDPNELKAGSYIGQSFLRYSYDERSANGEGLRIFESNVRFDDSLGSADLTSSGLALRLNRSRGVYSGGTNREGGNSILTLVPLFDNDLLPNDESARGKIAYIEGVRTNPTIRVFRDYWDYGRTGIVWTDSTILRQVREELVAAKPVIQNMHAVLLSDTGELVAKDSLEVLHRYKGNPLWENYRSGSKPNSLIYLEREYPIEGRPKRSDQLVLTSADTREKFLVASFAVRTR